MITLKLNDNDWDIELDKNGGIKISDGDYEIAQTCANAIRLFTNDAYFDKQRGIPHFDIDLGNPFNRNKTVIENRMKIACLDTKGVTDCKVTLVNDEEERILGGRIDIATENGAKIVLEI